MIALRNEHQVFNRLGSFWTAEMAPESVRQARCLAETAQQNNAQGSLLRGARRLTWGGAQVSRNLKLAVPITAVSQVADSPRPQWTMPIQLPIVPLTIHTRKGPRSLGVDFNFADGVITWLESPYDLFFLPEVLVLTYEETPPTLWNYTLRLDDATEPVEEVVKYYRRSQDPSQFERAIAAAAGYAVLPFTSTLRAVSGSRYVFDDGVITADYTHTPLTVGQTYEAGTIIGDMVKVRAAPASGGSWYREFDWSHGLSLDTLSPFRGLRVRDELRRLQTTTQSTAHPGHYHSTAQFDLDLIRQSGSATVPANVSIVSVNFEQRFEDMPMVTGSPVAADTGELSAVTHVIYDVTNFGFKVAFSGPSGQSFSFHWVATVPGTHDVQTTVPAGTSKLSITYPVAQNQVPIITGSLETDSNGDIEVIAHIVSLPTKTGFDLLLASPPSRDVKFNWTYGKPNSYARRQIVSAGSTELTVVFAKNFVGDIPLLQHSLQNADEDTSELIPYVITHLSTTGFKVLFSQPLGSNSFFHWSAFENQQNIRERFWAHQAAMEDITGVFLADAVGLTSPGFISANLLEIYFQYLLASRGMVVELKQNSDNASHVEKAERFISREKPIGSALILRYS